MPPHKLGSYPMPAADLPVVAALQQPALYLVTPGPQEGNEGEAAWLGFPHRWVRRAAGMLDAEARQILDQAGRMPEPRLLLMAGLMLADRTSALEDRAASAERELARLKSNPPRIEVPVIPAEIGEVILDAVARVKATNPSAVYACDPVMGNAKSGCFVAPAIPVLLREVQATDASHSTLILEDALGAALDRASVVIHANVARAAHGEGTAEILGGGDPARPFQRFLLKQAPVSQRQAPTETGVASTLTLRIDGVAWQ